MDNIIEFKKYPDITMANDTRRLLASQGIESIVEEISSGLGAGFGNDFQKDFLVKIKKEDIEKATKVLETQAQHELANVPQDYYLFSFTDEELYSIVLKKEEWSEFDYLLAKKLLADRNKPVDEGLIAALEKERNEELKKAEKVNIAYLYTGYFCAFFGGILGIIIGYILYTSKKQLLTGETIYTYTLSDRKQGRFMMILGIIMLPLWIAFRIFRDM